MAPGPMWSAKSVMQLLDGLLVDAQIIGHGKNAGNRIGLDVGDIPVTCVGHHAFQSHVSVLDDNVDGRHGLQRVPVERSVAIDGAVESKA